MPQRSVRDYVAPVVAVLLLDLTLDQAQRRLRDSGREALPVLDDGHVIGILTEGELDAALSHNSAGLLRDHPTLRVVYCFADSKLAEAEAMMQAAEVNHLAVLDESAQLLGLLARRDLPSTTARTATLGRPGQGTLSASCRYQSV